MKFSPTFDLCGFKFQYINHQNKRLLMVRAKEIDEALGNYGPTEEFMDYCKDEREPYYCESKPDPIPENGIKTISESDLFTLKLNSNHPQTEAFQNWMEGNAIYFIAKAFKSATGEELSIEDAFAIMAIVQSKVLAFKDK